MGHSLVSQVAPGKVIKNTALVAPDNVVKHTVILQHTWQGL